MVNEIGNPIVAAVAALLGVVVGLVLGRLLLPGPREVKRLRGELETRAREQAEYEARVAGHFRKTGELIGQLTESYKAVYDHLAQGAQTLCATSVLPKPAFAAPRLIIDDEVKIGDDRAGTASHAATSTIANPEPVASPSEGGTVSRDTTTTSV